MNRRKIILTALTALIAATTTTTALAASGAKDPKTMVLQKSDLPAGARLVELRDEEEPDIHAYHTKWEYKVGAKEVSVSSMAMVMRSRLWKIVASQPGKLLELPPGYRKITLPKYGDEQRAGLSREDNTGALAVLKGSVLWNISVTWTGEVVTKAEAIAQLKRYAPKQMKRVGSG